MPDDPALFWNSDTPWSDDDRDLAWCRNDGQTIDEIADFLCRTREEGRGADRSAVFAQAGRLMAADDLTDAERAAVISALRKAIDNDRYPRAPRLAPYRSALAKLDPGSAVKPPEPKPPLPHAPSRTRDGKKRKRV